MEAKPVKMRLHFFNSAVIENSKLDYSICVIFFVVSGLGQRNESIQEMKSQQSALYNYRVPISILYSNKI